MVCALSRLKFLRAFPPRLAPPSLVTRARLVTPASKNHVCQDCSLFVEYPVNSTLLSWHVQEPSRSGLKEAHTRGSRIQGDHSASEFTSSSSSSVRTSSRVKMPLITNDHIHPDYSNTRAQVARHLADSPIREDVELNASSRQHTKLLQLPRELLIKIISELVCRHLCALRLTNRQLHNLIHENESTIIRKYLGRELRTASQIFAPVEPLNLSYRFEVMRRLHQVGDLSLVLANRCCSKLIARRPLDDEEAWRRRKTTKLHEVLLMSTFALYEFLARFREIVLRSLHEFDGCSTAEFARLGFVLGLDQQQIFESFPKHYLMHTLHAWRILKGVAASLGVPFGCKSAEYPYTTAKVMLVLGGLDRFTALMNKPSVKERIQDLDAFNAEIWKGQRWKPRVSLDGPPLGSIYHLDAPPKRVSSTDFPKNVSPTAPVTFINRQQICEPSVTAVILRSFGTLDSMLPVDQYICKAIKEEGDPSYHLLSWSMPDNPA